jgi:hypothetical protein
MFLPSQWFKMLSRSNTTKDKFDMMFGLQKLEAFWKSQDLRHPKFQAIKGIPNLHKRCIPVVIHGDAADYQDRDSLLSISMTGLLRDGSTLDTSLLLAPYKTSPNQSFAVLSYVSMSP